MHTSLTSELPVLRALAALRQEVSELRASVARSFENALQEQAAEGYNSAGDDIEVASCLLACISTHAIAERPTNHLDLKRALLRRTLTCKTASAVFSATSVPGDSEHIRLLWAARALAAVSQMPLNATRNAAPGVVADGNALHAKVMLQCYYAIRRELNSAAPPMRMVGAARPGAGAAPSAFMTGECTRALRSLASALDSTAALMDDMLRYHSHIDALRDVPPRLQLYREGEMQRLRHYYATRLQEHGLRSLWRPETTPGTLNVDMLLDKREDAIADFASVLEDLLSGARAARSELPATPSKAALDHMDVGDSRARATLLQVQGALEEWIVLVRQQPGAVARALVNHAHLVREFCSGPPARFLVQRL